MGNEDTPTNRELARVFQGMGIVLRFLDRQRSGAGGQPGDGDPPAQEQHKLIGFDIFCANHHVGPIKTEHAVKSMELFAKEVMPAFA